MSYRLLTIPFTGMAWNSWLCGGGNPSALDTGQMVTLLIRKQQVISLLVVIVLYVQEVLTQFMLKLKI